MTSLRWAALLLLVPACGDQPTGPREPLSRIDLRAAAGRADVTPVGITIDSTGARVVLDEEAGLFRIQPDGTAQLMMAMGALPDPGVEIRPPFTDVVALAPDQLAMTAIGDGFVLDLAAGTLTRRFCYEPGGFPEDQEQRTNALGFDPLTGNLYAQPRTFQEGEVVRSELGMYAHDSGIDLDWWTLPTDFDAGGLVVVDSNKLLLGAGPRLLRYDLDTARMSEVDNLIGFGVGDIEGLAIDPDSQTLLVLDGTRDELVEIELAQLSF